MTQPRRIGALVLLVAASAAWSAGADDAPVAPGGDPLTEIERRLESAAPVRHGGPEPHTHPEPHRHSTPHHVLEAFGYDFIRRALVAGALAGAICAWLGVFVVLRRMVFVGVALAQVASAGVAIGVYLGWPPMTLALAATLSVSVLSGLARVRGDLNPESRIGIVYVLAGSVAVILLARSGTGEAEQLEMLQGSLLTVPVLRVWHLAGMLVAILALHGIGYRKLVAVAFDPLTAHVAGVRVWLWNLVFFLALGAGISVSIQSCGLLLVFGYLLVPAAAGLVSGLRLPGVFLVAMACQALSTAAGLSIAYEFDWPPGPSIVVTMLCFLPLAAVARATVAR
jgi:ABC-type Mn2+/Zn2+ transport system permease subunit